MAKLMGRGNSAPEGHSAVGLESPSCPHCSQNVQLVSRHLSSCGDTRTFWFKHSPEAVVPYYLVRDPLEWERGSVSHGGNGMKWTEPGQGTAVGMAQPGRETGTSESKAESSYNFISEICFKSNLQRNNHPREQSELWRRTSLPTHLCMF